MYSSHWPPDVWASFMMWWEIAVWLAGTLPLMNTFFCLGKHHCLRRLIILSTSWQDMLCLLFIYLYFLCNPQDTDIGSSRTLFSNSTVCGFKAELVNLKDKYPPQINICLCCERLAVYFPTVYKSTNVGLGSKTSTTLWDIREKFCTPLTDIGANISLSSLYAYVAANE